MESPETIDLTRGVPPTQTLPEEKITRCLQESMDEFGKSLLGYRSDLLKTVQGFEPLLNVLADQMGSQAEARDIFVGNGSLDVFSIIANSVINDSGFALVERPSYDRAITTLKRTGSEVVGIPMEEDGIKLDQLEEVARKNDPDLLYTIPDFQNPSGTTLSEEKRFRLIEIANEHDFWVVEDSPYYNLRYLGEDKPTLWSIDPGRVFYVSSFSKLISPGLRVGWSVVPSSIAGEVFQLAEDRYITPSMLSQGVVYKFMDNGWFEPNIESLKKLYEKRLETILDALKKYMPRASWVEPKGGFFLGLYLPGEISYQDLEQKADSLGLKLSDSRKFFPTSRDTNFVRIPFCSVSSEEIREAIKRMGKAFN